MMATRFSTVGWAGCVCVAALSFYLVSQTVAAKRAELVAVDRRIAATQREIVQLETEIGTRGGMAQIENWNSRVYGLQAPGADQFVNSSVQLVAMADPQPLPLDPAISAPHGPVQQASLTAPPPAAPVARPLTVAADTPDVAPVERPMVRQATYITPQRAAMAPDGADIHKASYTRIDADVGDKPEIVKPARTAEPKPAEPRAVAKAEAKAPPKLAAKKVKDSKAATKMTALDDAWLAEVTAGPAAHRPHKARP